MATILIVDDEPAVRMLCVSMLASHRCVEAEHGKAALAQIKQNSFDLVITDLKMPVMSGLELILAIRECDSELPIVVITGDAGDESSHRQTLEFGAQALVKKPFRRDNLINSIEPWL